jgi:DNA-binding transcriptional MerR regulator
MGPERFRCYRKENLMKTKVRNSINIPVKLYRIGELVRHTPFSRQTIHNYTIMGLINEAEWTEGGHRLYDESVFSRLSRILQLKRTKKLSEIRQIIQQEDSKPGVNDSRYQKN